MMTRNTKKNGVPAPENEGPGEQDRSSLEHVAVVQCDGFRCLAFQDSTRKWRDFHTGKELPEVKEVVFTFAT